MAVTVREIVAKMEQWCPAGLACSWDNCGLQTGHRQQEVNRILVALDATMDVIDEAAEVQADMIMTHHPLIFTPLQHLCTEYYPQAALAALLKTGIAYFAAHTNLDMAAGGVNDTLAAVLGLEEVKPFAAADDMNGLGRIGMLPGEMSFAQLEALVKEKLGLTYLKAVPAEKEIHSVAVCGGSGMDLLWAAKEAGADCLISSEGKHHQGIVARQLGIGLIDAGHFDTEKVIIPVIVRYLRESFPGLEVLCSKREQNHWLIR